MDGSPDIYSTLNRSIPLWPKDPKKWRTFLIQGGPCVLYYTVRWEIQKVRAEFHPVGVAKIHIPGTNIRFYILVLVSHKPHHPRMKDFNNLFFGDPITVFCTNNYVHY